MAAIHCRVLIVGLAVSSLAACGSHHSQRAAIVAALAHDPQNYLYYRAPIWWGRPVSIRVELVRARGDWAVAEVYAPAARPYFARQWLLLFRRGNGTWGTAAVVDGRAVHLPCRDAPRGVIVGLVGGCILADLSHFEGLVRGPTAFRAPTAGERPLIVRAFDQGRHCGPFTIQVSRLAPRYAAISAGNGNCGNGISLVVREHGRWTLTSGASSGFACRNGPPGVMRSLFGECWTD